MGILIQKLKHHKNAIVVAIIFLFSASLTAWNVINGYLIAKSLYLFPSFDFDKQKGLLIVAIISVVVLLIFSLILAIPRICNRFSRFSLLLFLILLVFFSILLVVESFVLSFVTAITCNSKTSDLNNYLVFDSAIEQEEIIELFPSKNQIDGYIANGTKVSYEYIFESGKFDSESEYSIVLTVSEMDAEQYQAMKAELVQTHGASSNSLQEKTTITVENTTKTDIDGYDFFICRSVTFDDKNYSIVYSATKCYPR